VTNDKLTRVCLTGKLISRTKKLLPSAVPVKLKTEQKVEIEEGNDGSRGSSPPPPSTGDNDFDESDFEASVPEDDEYADDTNDSDYGNA